MKKALAFDIGGTKIYSSIIDETGKILSEIDKFHTPKSIDGILDILKGQKVIKEETPQYIKENYIPKDKIEEILSETEITDFNSLVEAFLEIKKLLESE